MDKLEIGELDLVWRMTNAWNVTFAYSLRRIIHLRQLQVDKCLTSCRRSPTYSFFRNLTLLDFTIVMKLGEHMSYIK